MIPRLVSLYLSLLGRRWHIIGAAAFLTALAAIGASRVRVDYGVEQFFLPDGPERAAFDQYRSAFPREDTRFSLFWKLPYRLTAANYRDLERVAGEFQAAGLENVRWPGNMRSAATLEWLVDPAVVTDSALGASLRRHRDDELLRGYLWNADQTVFAVHGDIDPARNTDAGRRAVEEDLTRRIAGLELRDGEVVLGGLPLARSRAPKLLEVDLRLLAGAAFLVSGLLLLYFLRHPLQVLITLASVAPAYLCVIGLMGFTGKPISILTSFVAVIVLVIGMADAIHLVAEFRRHRAAGAESDRAVVATFSELALPCFWTTVTTAIGFGGLATTGIGIVVDFAAYTSLAIGLTFLFSMTLLPVLLSFTRGSHFNDRGLQARWLRSIVVPAIRRAGAGGWRTALVFVVVGTTALAFGLQLRVNTFLIDDIREDAPVMRDIRWIEREGFALFQLAIHLRPTGGEPLYQPATLKWMDELRSVAQADPLVQHTFALTDILTPLRGAMAGGSDRRRPGSTEESAQLLLVAQLDDPDLAGTFYHPESGNAQVIITLRDEGSVRLAPFLARMEQYLASHPVPGGDARLTGTVVMIQAFTERLLRNLGLSVLLDLVLISLVMMGMLRSVRLGLLAVVPNAFPMVVLMGAMGLGGFDLKPSTILVFSIAYGLAVDNTIHLLTRFIHTMRSRPGATPRWALRHSLHATGPALVMTSVVVTAGFAVLTFSQFQVLFLIGLMTVISGIAELAGDLFLFPPLLGLAARRAWALQPAAAPAPMEHTP